MYAAGALVGGGNFHLVDPLEERDPPAQATAITFPKVHAVRLHTWNENSPPPNLEQFFSKVVRPIDVTSRQFDALNIDLVPSCPVKQLVPAVCKTSSPTTAPPENTTSPSRNDQLSLQRTKDLEVRLDELKIENLTAYRTIQRQPLRQGEKPQRIAYMRKFYEGLESMSQYWDCSLDQQYELPPLPSPASSVHEGDRKRQRLFHRTRKSDDSETPASLPKQKPCRKDSVMETSPRNSDEQDRLTRSSSCTPEPHPRLRYKGFRTATGRDMPETYRFNTIKGFVEQAVWPFRANIAPPRRQPLVKINHLNVPVRQSAVIHRIPSDREKARRGIIEGPIMGLQVRHELDFTANSDSRALLDQMREIGGLLQLAQERRREGRTEVRAGENKWWTTKPRFGASSDHEPLLESDADGRNDVLNVVEEVMMGRREQGASTRRAPIQRKTPVILWQELKPASEKWDPRTDYQAIGKDPASDYDEVFMVSSLNHHISVLKLTVHDAYLEYLESATSPNPAPLQQDWCQPRLQRTKWFDIFDVDERQEAFTAITDVMTYLTRELERPQRNGTMMAEVRA
ncbi:hypothetical protein K431DRAFT_155641 [Polychaeton citri CBS 116435]|uniref:Uncharacterized protein n=1 Tax=Polychaeton citri CBS 116435 TaxID=1314669 RepID=A0A9P4UT27_9PEZI|nr:hypothetical protein K431DRAFT_155641 [Polychaeton citri CBS 116435]